MMVMFRKCKHLRVRCIHGDEINFAGGKRAACLDCARLLPDLPTICSVTGETHYSAQEEPNG